MMALEKHAATASHWSAAQYQTVFASSGTRRVALLIEEDARMNGFLVARALDREWEIENVVVAGPTRRRGLGTRLLGEFLNFPFAVEGAGRSEEHTSELQSQSNLVCRLLLEKKKKE